MAIATEFPPDDKIDNYAAHAHRAVMHLITAAESQK